MESVAKRNKQALTKKTYEVKFDLSDTQYEAVDNIGSGAYGVVCSALNKLNKEKVAIKKIPNIFDQDIITKRTYREIKILKHFKHDNIIAIREILKPTGSADNLKDVYIVFDLMESDLHRIIHSKQDLSIDHAKYFVYQILCGLQYIHSAHVVHRDLKPSNLLVNANCDLKIGDFGMARGMGFVAERDYKLTQYVATRWYRAPELMSSKASYTASVDMWSVGCIFAELLGRRIIFMGRTPIEQLYVIMDTLGEPPKHLRDHGLYSMIIKGHGAGKKTSLREKLPKAPVSAMHLLELLLVYDPVQRLDVNYALKHAFLVKYHDPDSVYEKPCIPVFNFDFEQKDLTKDQLKEAIIKEIMDYHKPKRKSKIPFNFKPVPKSELEKTQQRKAAALKAKLEAESKPQNDATTGLTAFVNQSNEESISHDSTGLEAFLKQKQQPNSLVQVTVDSTALSSQNFSGASQKAPNRDDVFKVPHDLPISKQQLQVSTQRESSQDIEMVSAGRSGTQKTGQGQAKVDNDIEMLSAKSEVRLNISQDFKIDLKQYDSGTKPIEAGKDSLKDEKVNTKEKLKAAILESALRKQRGEMVARPKPVTAMQRQKEKEEKRRKKFEKAKTKKKQKMKEQSPLLTSEDRELLQRWTNMQKIKPDSTSQSLDQPGTSRSATQYRPVLSPKNTNVTQTVTSVTQSQTSERQPTTEERKGTFGVNCESTRPQVFLLQNYVRPQVQVNSSTASQVGVRAQNTLMNPLFQNPYGTQISQINGQPAPFNVQSQLCETQFGRLGTPQLNSTNVQQNVAVQNASNSQPPDYSQPIRANRSPQQSIVHADLTLQTGSEEPSPTEFLPFHNYDSSSHGNTPEAVRNQLTPDLSMFDSPNPSHLSTTAGLPSQVYNTSPPVVQASSHSNNSGHSNDGATRNPGDNPQILSIITQMKKSHMNDPLLLTLTPKTAGEPYGVGPDIGPDMFLTEDRASAQLSAMSNTSATESLIGDWLDLIGMEGVANQDYETLKKELKALEPDAQHS